MKADTNSIHAKLYRFTYESSLPNNLCPYFWKLFLAIVLFIPNFLLQLPALTWMLFSKDNPLDTESTHERLGLGAFLWIIITLASAYLATQYHLIKEMFNCYSYNWDLALAGIVADSIAILITIIYFIVKKIEDIRYKNYLKPQKNPGIIKEFIRAKKNKYCPKIDWN